MTLFWLFEIFIFVCLRAGDQEGPFHARGGGGEAVGLPPGHPKVAGLPPVLLDPAAVALGDEPLPAPGGHLAHELVGEEASGAAAVHEPLEDTAEEKMRDLVE